MALTLVLAGCGGGGGGGGGSASGSVNLFLTDDLTATYSSVWVRIFKVELESASGRRTVFDSAEGKVFDLRALNDGSQRYAFLGKDAIPEGAYTGIRFTLGKTVSLLPTGSANAVSRDFADALLNPSNPNQALLTLSFGAAKQLAGSGNDLVADFVLSSWTDDGTKLSNCVVQDAPTSGLSNPGRHDEDEFKGTVAGLSGAAPNFTFTLNTLNGNTLTVTTDSATSIFNNNGSPNPQLANGKRVEIHGAYSPSTSSIVARSIKIKNANEGDGEDPHQVKGLISNVSFDSFTFDVTLGEAEGFIPTSNLVHVTTGAATRFFTHGGVLITQGEFFNLLKTAKRVEAEGVWNAETNTIAAVKAKIEDEDEDHNAEGRGTANTIDGTAGTFRIQLTEWEGFSASVGTQLNVVTTGSTTYRDANGADVSKEQFFALLPGSAGVKVEGAYAEGTITAKYARLRESAGGGGGGGGDNAEARGSVSEINAGAKTFDLRIVDWSGFAGSANLVIHVAFTPSATFRGLDGESLTAEAFFGQLVAGHPVEVEGSWSSATGTLTARKAKLED